MTRYTITVEITREDVLQQYADTMGRSPADAILQIASSELDFGDVALVSVEVVPARGEPEPHAEAHHPITDCP